MHGPPHLPHLPLGPCLRLPDPCLPLSATSWTLLVPHRRRLAPVLLPVNLLPVPLLPITLLPPHCTGWLPASWCSHAHARIGVSVNWLPREGCMGACAPALLHVHLGLCCCGCCCLSGCMGGIHRAVGGWGSCGTDA